MTVRTISPNEPTRYEIACRIDGHNYLVAYAARRTQQRLREALRSDALFARFEGCEYETTKYGIQLTRDGVVVGLVNFTGYTQRDRRNGELAPIATA